MGFPTPAPSAVTVTGTVSLNPGGIVGLAAGGVVGLTTPTQTGIATQIYSQGVPPVDNPATLYHNNIASGANTGALSTAGYNSVEISVAAPAAGEITISWLDASGNLIYLESIAFPVTFSATVRLPSKGAQLIVGNPNLGIVAQTLVLGSYRSIDRTSYLCNQQSSSLGGASITESLGDGYVNWQCAAAPPVSGVPVVNTANINSSNGPATFAVRLPANASTWDVQILDVLAASTIAGGVGISGTNDQLFTFDLILPCRPIQINITNHGAASRTAFANLVYDTT